MSRDPLDTEIQYLKGVGPKLAPLFSKVGIKTVRDVLYHLPRRYEDRSHLPPMSTLRPGDWATVRGRLTSVDARTVSGNRVIIKAMLSDGRSGIQLVWFNQPWVRRKLEAYKGEVIAFGQIKEGSTWLEMASPEYELIDEDGGEAFARITPVYPLTEGLSQIFVRRAAASALDNYLHFIADPLPENLRRRYDLPPLDWSLRAIHRPETDEDRKTARRRLVFEEFFVMQMALAMQRAETERELGIAFQIPESVQEEMTAMLPFRLTGAQQRVIGEIFDDLRRGEPMNRLVQGDVGSGKTAVAACAMLGVVRSGYQACLMAPTEILAEQHAINLRRMLEPCGISVAMLVGKLTAAQKKKAYEQVRSGAAQVAVGTHALIQDGVEFAKLGLAIIDEQHRFGVMQRAALRAKGFGNPDVLVMTATPIPRTLTMALYGDLDLSVIDELPPGRTPIKTHWRPATDRPKIYEAVQELVANGQQAYVVCPLVADSDKMQAQAAEDLYYRLTEGAFRNLRVGLLHGQQKPAEKEATMEAFRRHELDVLVSTTVIEVGVDVPNATTMIVEDANRFGLSQLHQLRGRVGRGAQQSFCILIADAKTEESRRRMEIMAATSDGFKIAEEDLRIRGPGEMAGTRQHGNLDLKVADLIQDAGLLEEARGAALKLAAYDPFLEKPPYQALKAKVLEWRARINSAPMA